MQDPLTPELLRDARQSAGLSQRELAARLGVRPMTVSEWELGRAEITLPASRIALALVSPPSPRDPHGLARRNMEWALSDTTVMRRHLDGMERRVRESIAALDALAALPPR
jgi:DNA-binding XRE family transcriptional regulator